MLNTLLGRWQGARMILKLQCILDKRSLSSLRQSCFPLLFSLCSSFSSVPLSCFPQSPTRSVVNKKLKFICGLIEHTESRTIHTYIRTENSPPTP